MRASHRKAWKRKAWTWKVWEHKFLFVEGRQEVGTEAVPEYEWYADIWFLTNFAIDAIALWAGGKFLRQPAPLRRILLGSLAGTAASLFFFLVLHDYICYQLAVHLFVNPSMVWLCYHKKKPFIRESGDKERLKPFLRQWAAVYLAVLLLGGFLEWGLPKGTGSLHALVCLAGAAAVVEGADWLMLHIRREKETTYDLLLLTREGRIPARGFYDTGNLLADPLLGRPVHIARKSLIWGQIQREALPLRLIPYHSLGRESGMLEAVTLEGMYILQEEGPVYLDKPVFGIADEKLFQDDRCDVILNGKSIER